VTPLTEQMLAINILGLATFIPAAALNRFADSRSSQDKKNVMREIPNYFNLHSRFRHWMLSLPASGNVEDLSQIAVVIACLAVVPAVALAIS